MPIDSFTVVLFGLLIKLVLGVMFMVFWLRSRAAPWFGWWGGSLLLGSVTATLYLIGGQGPTFISTGMGNAVLIAVLACCWQGARAFGRQGPLWSAVLLPPGLWLAAALAP